MALRSADDHLYAGLSLLRLNEPARAVEVLEAGLGTFPEHERLLEHYVRLCADLGQIDRAIQRFSRGTKSSAETCEALFAQFADSYVQVSLVEYCLNHGLAELAESKVESIGQQCQDTTSAWRLADLLLQHSRGDQARAIYQGLAARLPENAEALIHSALAEYRLRNPERAMDVLEQGVADYPEAGHLREHFLRVCAEQGQVERMIRVLVPRSSSTEQALETLFDSYKDPQIQVNLMGCFLRVGLTDLAEKKIGSALQSIHDAEPLWNLSDLLLKLGRKSDAGAIYEHLSSRASESAQSVWYAGLAAYRLERPEQAADILEQGLQKFPGTQGLLEHFARISIELHEVKRVARFVAPDARNEAEACELLFERFGDSPIQVKLVEYCAKHGLADLAERELTRIQQTSRDATTLWNVAELLAKFGRRNEAIDIYKRLYRRELEHAEDYYYAALALLRLENSLRCLDVLEEGQRRFPADGDVSALYMQVCARRLDYKRYRDFVEATSSNAAPASILSVEAFYEWASKRAPVDFIVTFKDFESNVDAAVVDFVKKRFVTFLRESPHPAELARTIVFFSRYLDLNPEFCSDVLDAILDSHRADTEQFRADERSLRILYDLSPPMVPHYAVEPGKTLRQFISASRTLAEQPVELSNPIVDMTTNWTPWQLIFCRAELELYGESMAEFEKLAFKTWPRLNHVASHVGRNLSPAGKGQRKIRIGFNVHDSMPMMSGLLAHLDPDIFETVFLRPGKPGQTPAAKSWIERAGKTVEFSDIDTYAAIETIEREELDIIVAGPATATSFYPMMAKLATLQMILLEPNWTDGLSNSDYYISWRQAEPEEPSAYYKTAVSFLDHPPYWIEKPAVIGEPWPLAPQVRDEARKRLLNCASDVRVYLCANTPPKVHPEMDDMFRELLERDEKAVLVFLRAEYNNLRIRLREKLGKSFDRLIFLPALSKDDAHLLLQAVDCCLDSYPLCGMSSSFDGAMLGVPIVTLPSRIPFGRWTAAIYDYINVSGLTAKDKHDYIDIALKLASDSIWRGEKALELRQKSARYVESRDSSKAFETFLLEAWNRRVQGLKPANWINGRWH